MARTADYRSGGFGLQVLREATALDTHIVLLTVFGAITLITAWIPMLLKNLPVSLPMVCIAIGITLGWSPLAAALPVNPLQNLAVTERRTEFVVIVSLMVAGLKLDRPLG